MIPTQDTPTAMSPARRRLVRMVLPALALVMTAVFAGLAFDVAATGIVTRGEAAITTAIHSLRAPALSPVMWAFTILADTPVAWALTATAVLMLALAGRRRDALMLAVAVGGSSALTDIVKDLMARPRPDAALALIKTPTSLSYPSGHASFSLAFWATITLLALIAAPSARRRAATIAVGVVMVLVTGFTRVYLGVHYPTDVAGGWLLAGAWFSACLAVYLATEPVDSEKPVATPYGTLAFRRVAVSVAVLGTTALIVHDALRNALLR